jgi:hypothetical protein
LSAMEGRHRDGVQFKNKQETLLQHLVEGQRVDVVSLSSGSTSDEGAAYEIPVITV